MTNNIPMSARLKPKTTVGSKFSCPLDYESACDVIFNKLKIREKDIQGLQNIPNNRVAVKFIEDKVFGDYMKVRRQSDSFHNAGKDSDKGQIQDEEGTPDVQQSTDELCEAVGDQLVTITLSKNVDDVAVHQHTVEIDDRSRDLKGHVPSNSDNLTDTDSDSDIFSIKSAPEGASQVTEINEDEGLPSQDEPRIPYTIGSLIPVEDDINEEPGNLKKINIAVSVHRDGESVDGTTEECDMDVEVNKISDIEDELKNGDKGSDVMPKGQWNIDLDTVGKLKVIRGKSIKEKR
ncbi:uncharacterized protein, partial [Palaemon carinicauda]|uniref:uncharacterized protein n=1 Tax=Palaemon carinicauda TaxID=392227 RepID=UPI0035B5F2A7